MKGKGIEGKRLSRARFFQGRSMCIVFFAGLTMQGLQDA